MLRHPGIVPASWNEVTRAHEQQRAGPAGRPRDADRPLLRLFGDVQAGEGVTVLLMLSNIFLTLLCYSIIKVVREPLILLGGGAEVRSYSSAGQALLLMLFVPFYSWFASKVDRRKLLIGVTLFFVVNIELFALAVAAHVPLVGVDLQQRADGAILVVRQRHLTRSRRGTRCSRSSRSA